MATMTFNIQVVCEVQTFDEALAEARAAEDSSWVEYIQLHPQHYPMPISIERITCNDQEVKDEAEDYMEHRYLIAGTGGDGYTLSVTHYIV